MRYAILRSMSNSVNNQLFANRTSGPAITLDKANLRLIGNLEVSSEQFSLLKKSDIVANNHAFAFPMCQDDVIIGYSFNNLGVMNNGSVVNLGTIANSFGYNNPSSESWEYNLEYHASFVYRDVPKSLVSEFLEHTGLDIDFSRGSYKASNIEESVDMFVKAIDFASLRGLDKGIKSLFDNIK